MTVTDEINNHGAELTVTDEIADFSVSLAPIRFRIDEDLFLGPRVLPADQLIEFTDEFNRVSDDAPPDVQRDMMHRAIRRFLYTESADRFVARMGDPNHPIGMDQVNRVVMHLTEQHGMRPTTPSDDSSSGSVGPSTGT